MVSVNCNFKWFIFGIKGQEREREGEGEGEGEGENVFYSQSV